MRAASALADPIGVLRNSEIWASATSGIVINSSVSSHVAIKTLTIHHSPRQRAVMQRSLIQDRTTRHFAIRHTTIRPFAIRYSATQHSLTRHCAMQNRAMQSSMGGARLGPRLAASASHTS